MKKEMHIERKNRIEKAALELISLNGWAQVSMKDVASESNMAVGTLYNYFPSKHDLLASLFKRELLDQLKNNKPETLDEWLDAGFNSYTTFSREEWRSFFAFLYSGKKEGHLQIWESQKEFIEQLGKILYPVTISRNLDLQIITKLIFSSFFQKFQYWVHVESDAETVLKELKIELNYVLDHLK